MKEKRCPYCGKIIHGHPNKKFCNNKGVGNCKDSYHNSINPRGIALGRDDFDDDFDDDQGWDAHKQWR